MNQFITEIAEVFPSLLVTELTESLDYEKYDRIDFNSQ